jgi:CDP-6-deoxy-D-xylo-4-hexulose-3-dehydrase
MLTQSREVAGFEDDWSRWLGVRHSVFVSSGSTANLLTMAALRALYGPGEVLVPTLTWISDIVAVLQAGFTPVFVDIDPSTLGMETDDVLRKLTSQTRAVFLTHVLGYNALTPRMAEELATRGIPLIEDACESHGATFRGKKLGTFGLVSNFSFYYAHHMSTIEGGMVSTDDDQFYDVVRMLRSHGMVREAASAEVRSRYKAAHTDLHPDFIFAYPGYNARSTELNALIGRSQLSRLDANNTLRRKNLALFLELLDPAKYRTSFATEGSCNYALTLVLSRPDIALRDRVVEALTRHGVEFRRGLSGGGNQLRQPYLRERLSNIDYGQFPNVEHVHFFGFYIGNYPELDPGKIRELCAILNSLEADGGSRATPAPEAINSV